MKLFRILLFIKKQCNGTKITRTPFSNITNALFSKHLLLTNTISAGLLMSAGDLMSQKLEHRLRSDPKPFAFNWKRCGNMFVVGALQGPLHHYFYKYLDHWIHIKNIQNAIKKVLVDQLIMSPICIVAFFYPAGWIEGQTTKECSQELKDKFVTVYLTDWAFWPACQFINFYYLPAKYRVLYVNFITMIYDVFLCYIKYGYQNNGTSIK